LSVADHRSAERTAYRLRILRARIGRLARRKFAFIRPDIS
jgi:hypothetical protein